MGDGRKDHETTDHETTGPQDYKTTGLLWWSVESRWQRYAIEPLPVEASVPFVSPKQASAMPASQAPNFSAPRGESPIEPGFW